VHDAELVDRKRRAKIGLGKGRDIATKESGHFGGDVLVSFYWDKSAFV
jgi:hypothetical protein